MFPQNECRWTSRRLWENANAVLPERDTARIEAHLAVCASCRRESEEYKTTSALMNGYRMAQPKAEVDGWHALRARLESPSVPFARRRTVRLVPAFAACAIAAAAFLCWIAGQFRGARTPTASWKPTPPILQKGRDAVAIAGRNPRGNSGKASLPSPSVRVRMLPALNRVASNAAPAVHRTAGASKRSASRIPTVAWQVRDVRQIEANVIRPAVLASVNEETGAVRLVPIAVATPYTGGSNAGAGRYTPAGGVGPNDTDAIGGND